MGGCEGKGALGCVVIGIRLSRALERGQDFSSNTKEPAVEVGRSCVSLAICSCLLVLTAWGAKTSSSGFGCKLGVQLHERDYYFRLLVHFHDEDVFYRYQSFPSSTVVTEQHL